jgi:hypothetical protein
MAATPDKSAKELAYAKFENVFKETLISQILGHAKKCKLPKEYQDYFEKVSIYSRLFLLSVTSHLDYTFFWLPYNYVSFFFWFSFLFPRGFPILPSGQLRVNVSKCFSI